MYKDHPFVFAVETIMPLLLPSFTLRSSRDGSPKISEYPLVEYAIIRTTNKTYEKSKRKFRLTFEVQLAILILEKSGDFSCDISELEEAKDRQAFFWELEKKINNFIQILVDPQSASSNIKFLDVKYSEYDFRLESYKGTQYVKRYTEENLTGAYAAFDVSMYANQSEFCCIFDDGDRGLEKQLQLVAEDSVSYKTIENKIIG